MKLFFAALAVALLASSCSAFLFGNRKAKQSKVVDINIHKEIGGGGGQTPVGQVPVGDAPLIGGELISLDGPLPPYIDDQQKLWIIQGGQGLPVRVGQIGFGTKGGPRPPGSTKTVPVGAVPIGGPIGHVGVGGVGGLVGGSINVPVLSQHSLQVVNLPVPAPYLRSPQLVSVEPSVQAVQLLFKSASSPLLVRQKHYGTHGSVYQLTRSEDNPHVLRHEVLKPVLQEVREIIQPFRSVTQQVNPVLEQVHTLVPRGQYQGQQYQQVGHQYLPGSPGQILKAQLHHGQVHHGQVQQRVHFYQNGAQDYQQPIQQEPIQQEPIEQEPIQQEPIEQAPIKGI